MMCDNAFQIGQMLEALSHRVTDLEIKIGGLSDHHIGGCEECAGALAAVTPAIAEDVIDNLADIAEEVADALEEAAEVAEDAGEPEAAEALEEAAEVVEEAAEVVEEEAAPIESDESEPITPARTHFLTRPIGRRNTV